MATSHLTAQFEIEVIAVVQNDTNLLSLHEISVEECVTDLSPVENIQVEVQDYNFLVSWDDPNASVDGYDVYVSDAPTGIKRKLNTSLIPSGTTSFLIPRTGQNRYVWITAVES